MQIPEFTGLDSAFGADLSAYPKMSDIPEEHQRGRSKGCKVASSLFFRGGSLADHGLELKPGVDSGKFHRALQALLCSFAPPHELKTATCGWLIDTHTQPATG